MIMIMKNNLGRRRGLKPQNKVKIKWSPEFAYAIGLLTTDGNLSPDGRHINLTSKDKEMILNFKKCLNITNKIGRKARGGRKEKKYYVLQFGDVNFYRFLQGIGLAANKSKILGTMEIPDKYFFDYLRGHFDGDGTFYFYWDPRWKYSFMFYTEFISASKKHIEWLRSKINRFLNIHGHITNGGRKICYQLKYAKAESIRLLPKLYPQRNFPKLSRKYLKIKKCLYIIDKQDLI